MSETLTPAQIRRGDRLYQPDGSLSWIAVGDAERRGSAVIVEVQYADGGCTFREWNVTSEVRFDASRFAPNADGNRNLFLI